VLLPEEQSSHQLWASKLCAAGLGTAAAPAFLSQLAARPHETPATEALAKWLRARGMKLSPLPSSVEPLSMPSLLLNYRVVFGLCVLG
jgi:hypothetical protein